MATYRGKVRNGAILVRGGKKLPEGCDLRIEVVNEPAPAAASQRRSWSATMRKFAGAFDCLPEDAAENHDHYIYGTPKRRKSRSR